MMIDITHITLVQGHGPDKLVLKTSLGPSVWPWEDPPSMIMECAADTGPDYATRTFPGVPVEIIRRIG